MKIAVGCDHVVFELKNKIMNHLTEKGIEYKEYDSDSSENQIIPFMARQ